MSTFERIIKKCRDNAFSEQDGIHTQAFEQFLAGLQNTINPRISRTEAIEMLSQHIITKPVFDALFEQYAFVKNNPISVLMQTMLNIFEEALIEKDTAKLQKFYDSVKTRVSGIDNAEDRQRIVIELYNKFFKTAFPKTVEKLGIVYTPVEVVDFILHSVDDVLHKEFGRTLSDENVTVIDPFTGTGTFITRLVQSGLIKKEDLPRKYEHEIFAHEIVLLAYYIAAINIENAYHDSMGGDYVPFRGICLNDTFQLNEADIKTAEGKKIVKEHAAHSEKDTPLTVIIGNPPYSAGQKSVNDNAQNQHYPRLEARIAESYVKESKATLNRAAYDSYIKAFRWASDRLDNTHGGIIGFITNSGWLGSNGLDGFRKSLEKEFAAIYVFDLKGAIRGKSGEAAKREGQNVFDIMTGVAITILVKKGEKNDK
jgi:predicted helicase